MKPLFSIDSIGNVYDDFVDLQVDKMVDSLKYLGEQIVNDMRNNGEYTDRTGNLRSSTGYFIINEGSIIADKYERGSTDEGGEGVSQAKKYAKEIMNEYADGLILVVFAGMEYAAAVESKGFDVITGSVEKMGNIGNKLKSLIND